VLDYLERQRLFQRVPRAAAKLREAVAPLTDHPHVGEIRGLGLLMGIEFVKDKKTREPFPKEAKVAEMVKQAALQKNVLTYPSQGCVDGLCGDHILLAPPFVISDEECSQIAQALQFAAAQVFPS
jgi:adenosylmethionine-8-amino-7-oxononanoate aminotransferase